MTTALVVVLVLLGIVVVLFAIDWPRMDAVRYNALQTDSDGLPISFEISRKLF
ncbi:MAG TPA: hypothetical protein VNQ76_03175 [Planctomicrobium sp.]|nr:hypothetical protein [Planctomicrobium sp.]